MFQGPFRPLYLSRTRLRTRPLLLVGVDWVRKKDPPLSLANASIAASVASITDVQTLTVPANTPDPASNIRNKLLSRLESLPDHPIVGIGSYIWAEHLMKGVFATVREARPDATIVIGGPQISYAPVGTRGDYLATLYPLADGFVRGYGEHPMRLLAGGLESRPSGYHPREFVDTGQKAHLDMLTPSPLLTGWVSPQRFLRWETQRGCPFSCSFCQHKSSTGKREILDDVRVLQEADWLCEQSIHGPLRDLAVVDPTFNVGPLHIAVIRRLAQGRLRGKLSLQCRLEMMTEEFLDAVCELHHTADVVLEFGIQTIHKGEWKYIQRPNNWKKVEKWIDRLNEVGIPYELSFIYGLPAQTLSSFYRTVEWAQLTTQAHSTGRARAFFFPLMLLRGTKLHDEAYRHNLTSNDTLRIDIGGRVGSNIPHVVSSNTFTFEEWLIMNECATHMNQQSPSVHP